MARTRNFRDLIAWQKAMELARSAYRLSEKLPRKEAYGLLAQIRRTAVSVPSNIAEGHGRLTGSQFRHFLGNARGSLCELQTQIELAWDLGFLDQQMVRIFMEQEGEVARLLNGLIASLGSPTRAQSANSANRA